MLSFLALTEVSVWCCTECSSDKLEVSLWWTPAWRHWNTKRGLMFDNYIAHLSSVMLCCQKILCAKDTVESLRAWTIFCGLLHLCTWCCTYALGVGSNSLQCTRCQKWVHKKCSGIKSSMSKVAKSFICRGCLNPVTSAVRTSVDIGASAKLELELVGISSGSWYHCLPIRTCLWLWEEGCTAVVWEAACYMKVRPGL